jgi:hypothetical protein
MIDFSRIKDSWGYESPVGGDSVQPGGPSGPNTTTKKLVDKKQETPTTGGTSMANTSNSTFNYPDEWGQAGDAWSQMASGNYTNAGMDWLTKLMQSGGGAFDQSGYDAANQPAMMDQFSNMTKQMAEQAGMGGSRYGSGLLNSIGNYGSQLQNQYNKDKWGNAFQGYEAGMGRAYGAGQGLSQFGLGAQQTGLEGLFGLGNAKAQLPLQVSQLLNNQEMGWAGLLGQNTGNQNAAPQTYTPSTFQSILQSLTSTLPGLLGSLASGGSTSGGITGGYAPIK